MGINDLNNVVNEMDVQDRYRTAFRKVFKDIIFESKYRSDGLAYSAKNKLRMIVEQKWKYNFSSIRERAEVVAQVIRYIKTIHDDNPTIMPKVAVFGDENGCFVLPVKDIINYISTILNCSFSEADKIRRYIKTLSISEKKEYIEKLFTHLETNNETNNNYEEENYEEESKSDINNEIRVIRLK